MIKRVARQLPWLALLVAAVAVADTTPNMPAQAGPPRPSVKPAVLRSEINDKVEAKQVAYTSGCASGRCQGCDQCPCCPRCQDRCVVDISKEDVKKHAWDIECEKICIPRVSFPWQLCKSSHACPGCGKSCCDRDAVCSCGCPQPAKCAKVRTVRKLVKHEYTCKKCKYTWTVKSVACGNCGNGNCNGGCVNNAAIKAANLANTQVQAEQESPVLEARAVQAARVLPASNSTLIPHKSALPPLPR